MKVATFFLAALLVNSLALPPEISDAPTDVLSMGWGLSKIKAGGNKFKDKGKDMANGAKDKANGAKDKASNAKDKVVNTITDQGAFVKDKVTGLAEGKLTDLLNGSIHKIAAKFAEVLERRNRDEYELVSSFGDVSFHVDSSEVSKGHGLSGKIVFKFSGAIGTGDEPLEAG